MKLCRRALSRCNAETGIQLATYARLTRYIDDDSSPRHVDTNYLQIKLITQP